MAKRRPLTRKKIPLKRKPKTIKKNDLPIISKKPSTDLVKEIEAILKEKPTTDKKHVEPELEKKPISEHTRFLPEVKSTGGISIMTNPDRLYGMIKSRGKITVKEAANSFDVSEHIIEEWGDILETHNLIRLHYPAFGKVTLTYREKHEKTKKIKEKKIEKTSDKPKKKGTMKKKIFIIILIGILAVVLLRQFGALPFLDTIIDNVYLQLYLGNLLFPITIVIVVLVALVVIVVLRKRLSFMKKRIKIPHKAKHGKN